MYKTNKQILFQKLGNEAVILHLETEEYYGLNEVGTRIWEVLTEQKNINQVISILLEEFDVEEEQLRTDVNELIVDLKAQKILLDE